MESGQADQGNVTLTFHFSKLLLQSFATGVITALLLMTTWWLITKLFSRYSAVTVYGFKKDSIRMPFVCGILLVTIRIIGWNWLVELYTRLKG